MVTGSDAARRPLGAQVGYGGAFGRLFEQGPEAVLAGTHYRDTPPLDGGRWGMSVTLQPDTGSVLRLAEMTADAMMVTGSQHWPTGAPEAVHLTVRAIEPHRTQMTASDPLVARCSAALTRAASRSRPVRLRLRGLTLTPSGVMACAYPLDEAPDEFARLLDRELGDDGWFKLNFARDIWSSAGGGIGLPQTPVPPPSPQVSSSACVGQTGALHDSTLIAATRLPVVPSWPAG